MRLMRTYLILVALAGCGSDNKGSSDAAIDAMIDAAPLTLDCDTYCGKIQANCKDSAAQYAASTGQCPKTCASFPKGTSTDETTGNTLGCRIHYAVAASSMPAMNCPHAGPVGDLITAATPGFCSGGNLCMSFCTLEIAACGSRDMPLPGDPKDGFGNQVYQYINLNNCMRLCAAWDKTHDYNTMAKGDSLACRWSAAVLASNSLDDAKLHCANTADTAPTGEQCTGPASP